MSRAMEPSSPIPSSLLLAKALSETPWTAVGVERVTAATTNLAVMMERNAAILERLLAKVVRARGRKSTSHSSRSHGKTSVSDYLSVTVRQQLRDYVAFVASLYRDVHFHSFEHASHVLLSASSMIHELLTANHVTESEIFAVAEKESRRQRKAWKHFATYGISSDPLLHFTFVFAALVHDVEHEGITNRQLVKEGHHLAIRYNDRSALEQNSLSVSYQLLLKPEYEELRKAIFATPEERQKFRSLLIDLIMTTDISSLEQTEIGKSKWKNAFKTSPEERYKQRKRKSLGEFPCPHLNETIAAADEAAGANIHLIEETEAEMCGESSVKLARGGSIRTICRRHSTSSCSTSNTLVPQENSAVQAQQKRTGSPVFGRRHSCTGSITSSSPIPMSALEHKPTLLSLEIQGTADVTETFPRDDERCVNENLRANAILIYMMQASDVAHTMQQFSTFVKWNHRLFDELYAAHCAGRGDDFTANWYMGQIAFLDSYVIPLAQRLRNCGVLGQFGFELVQNVMENRRRWIVEGQAHTDRFRELAFAKNM